MSRAATKEAAKKLLAQCEEEGVKLPTDPMNAMVAVGTMLNATKENGEFQMDKALEELITKYGQAEPKKTKKKSEPEDDADSKSDSKTKAKAKAKSTTPRKRATKRARADEDDSAASGNDDDDSTPKAKKARAKPTASNEANQELSDAFAELAGFEFKRGERFKGGAYSKVAKALRDCEDAIASGKQAMKLKGVGKAASAKIDEYLENGEIAKLEEYRAGNL